MIVNKEVITQDAGVDWTQSNKTDKSWYALCVTPTGRIIAGSGRAGIWYSDDNGVNWVQSNKKEAWTLIQSLSSMECRYDSRETIC